MQGSRSIIIPSITAAIILGGYIWFLWVLMENFVLVKDPVGHWDYAVTIFSSVSSLAFAAGGVLLGTSVQMTNVANAQRDKSQAEESQQRMKSLAKDALALHPTPLGGGDSAHQFASLQNTLTQILSA
jgi:hypothetical protein